MSLLGDDGRGFELARKLESLGVWRTWLGDSLYSTFVPFLSSHATWDSFMRSDDSTPKFLIHLQLRVRSLLFDKATASLFLSSSFSAATSPQSAAVSKLNPNYLHLHADDVYFTLEDGGVGSNTVASKSHSKSAYGIGSRYGESEMDNIQQRFINEDLPENWYNQFMEKHKVGRPYRLSLGERETDKRSPEEMSNYLRLLVKNKRRNVVFKPDQYVGSGNSTLDTKLVDDDTAFFPETMFMLNCVPDSALPPIERGQGDRKMEFHGVLDTLPHTKSSVLIERLGISVEQGGLHRGKTGADGHRKLLGQEQALQMSQKAVVNMLSRVGFEHATELPVEIFSQLLRCHISKLGRILKVLADSYRKQCSAIELLKMFLQTAGHSNLGSLIEIVKDGTRDSLQQTQQQVTGIQSHLQSQHQNAFRLAQQLQIPRQMHPQMQQLVHSQNMNHNLAFHQQQLERMRRRHPSSIRPGVDMDKDRPLVQVKLESPSELPMDSNTFSTMQSRHPQMQFRQQQLAAMSNFHAQSTNPLRQLASMQVPQMQSMNMGVARAPPVKVEGFQELMGGDTSSRHDSEENKLTSPQSK